MTSNFQVKSDPECRCKCSSQHWAQAELSVMNIICDNLIGQAAWVIGSSEPSVTQTNVIFRACQIQNTTHQNGMQGLLSKLG